MTQGKFYFYELSTLTIMHKMDQDANPTGILAISPSKEVCMIAFPDKVKGSVRVLDMNSDDPTVGKVIRAHDGTI
jgi:hypothetical protein